MSSYHALHPETGCVLPALGPEIARARPEVRAAVEQGLKRLQKSWSGRIGDPDAAWALLAQCVGALVLSRAVESERTRNEILASSRRFIDETHALDEKPAPAETPTRATVRARRRHRCSGDLIASRKDAAAKADCRASVPDHQALDGFDVLLDQDALLA